MALEPITRQEKIIAGQDLTPITRMEKFLKQYGGGSGGVTSWNDLTDKPFGETTTVKEVLAECQPVDAGDGMYQALLASSPDVAVGEKYIVTYNGADYLCEAVDGAAVNMPGKAAMGDVGGATGGASTGEPFVVIVGGDGDEAGLVAVPLDGSTTLTISIRQEVTEVKKISGKYVEGMGYSDTVSERTVWHEETAVAEGDEILLDMSNFSSLEDKNVIVTLNGHEYETACYFDAGKTRINFGDYEISQHVASSAGPILAPATEGETYIIKIEEVAEVETIHPIDEKLIVLTSPNGTKYSLSVADDGTLSAVAAT